ncbi:MAG: hypothetical protein WAL63_15900 [Solirubrobacteraceae bacterium]
MESPAHVVRLELRLDGDSPTGCAIGTGEEARRFAGWLGLINAVEALVTGEREHRSDADGDLARSEASRDDGIVA